MAGQIGTHIQAPNLSNGARTSVMNPDLGSAVVTGFGIAAGVGIFILTVYGLAYAFRRI